MPMELIRNGNLGMGSVVSVVPYYEYEWSIAIVKKVVSVRVGYSTYRLQTNYFTIRRGIAATSFPFFSPYVTYLSREFRC
jgi:hypothetical protein